MKVHNMGIVSKPEEIDSDEEVPFIELRYVFFLASGDEAIEKSFFQSFTRTHSSKTRLPSTSVSIMKSMLGIGILGLPNVVKSFGLLLTSLLLLLALLSSYYSSKLMLKEKNLSKHSNYSSIGFCIFESQWIVHLMKIVVIIANLSMMLGELIIFATTTTNIVSLHYETIPWYLSRECLLITVGVLLSPFMLVKKIEKLSFVNLTALLSLVFFCLFVIYNFIKSDASFELLLFPEQFNFNKCFRSLPTLILAFCWQYNLYPIFKGMRQPQDKHLLNAGFVGLSLAYLLYIVVGILGYATYGEIVQTNYLRVVSPDDVGITLYTLLNCTFIISTTLTQPLIFYGARNNFLSLLKKKNQGQMRGKEIDYQDINSIQIQSMTKIKRTRIINDIISLCLFFSLVVAALYLQDLEVIFGFLGIICANSIQLVLPTYFYFKLIEKKGYKPNIHYFVTKFVFCASLLLVVVCVVSEFI